VKYGALAVAALMVLSVVVAAQEVTTDSDTELDFGSVTTWTWGKGGTIPGNELSRKRLEAAMRDAITARGLQLVENGEADLLVSNHAVVDKTTQSGALKLGVGVSTRITKHGSIRVGASAPTKKETVEVGTLVIDVRAAVTGDPVWTVTASDTLKGDQDKRAAQIQDALARAFAGFPPQG
jgi:hypothetical protein